MHVSPETNMVAPRHPPASSAQQGVTRSHPPWATWYQQEPNFDRPWQWKITHRHIDTYEYHVLAETSVTNGLYWCMIIYRWVSCQTCSKMVIFTLPCFSTVAENSWITMRVGFYYVAEKQMFLGLAIPLLWPKAQHQCIHIWDAFLCAMESDATQWNIFAMQCSQRLYCKWRGRLCCIMLCHVVWCHLLKSSADGTPWGRNSCLHQN